MDTKRAVGKTDSQAGVVSVLVSIFQPNGVDLVDFRDFRDCTSSRVNDWESAK